MGYHLSTRHTRCHLSTRHTCGVSPEHQTHEVSPEHQTHEVSPEHQAYMRCHCTGKKPQRNTHTNFHHPRYGQDFDPCGFISSYLNRYIFHKVYATDVLFSPPYTTPFLYVKIFFWCLAQARCRRYEVRYP